MPLLRVHPGSMQRVSGQCESWATKLSAGGAAPDASSAGPAISAAVIAIGTEVTALGQMCAARMQARAAKVGTALLRYELNEDESAARLRRVGDA